MDRGGAFFVLSADCDRRAGFHCHSSICQTKHKTSTVSIGSSSMPSGGGNGDIGLSSVAPVTGLSLGTESSDARSEGTMEVSSHQSTGGPISQGVNGDDTQSIAGSPPSGAENGGRMLAEQERTESVADSTVTINSTATPVRARRPRRETPQQRERRLARQTANNQKRRRGGATVTGATAVETEEHYQERLARQRERNQRRLSAASVMGTEVSYNGVRETPSQRDDRLRQQRDYNKRQRFEETTEERVARLEEERVYRDEQRSDETVERRAARLEEQRLYREDQRSDETPEQREFRLAQKRTYSQNQRQLETPEQRKKRLAGVSANSHRLRQRVVVSEAGEMLSAVPEDTVVKVQRRLQDAMGADGLDERVCAVCDRLVLRTETRVINDDASVFSAIQTRLVAPTDLPPLLAAYYACGDTHASFEKLLLSRKGIRASAHGVNVIVCNECYESLSKGSSDPPKFSIANGFYIGQLPDHLAQATWIETIMTQLVTVIAQTRVMRGGRHPAIRSHCMVFDATPGPPATLLPRRVDRGGPYSIVLAGPMTASQTDTIRKLHRVRGGMVQELLDFYVSHNHFYSDVCVSSDRLQSVDDSLCDRVSIVHEDEQASAEMDDEQSSLVDDAAGTAGESEDDIIERNILLTPQDIVPDASFVQQVVDMNAHAPTTVPRLRVNHSSRHASTVNVEARMYPHLFPFGRGHPDETRRVHVSKRDCIRYYAMLSSRRFAQDPTFIMTAFVRLALENMFMLTSVKCKRYGSMFEGYEALSQPDLAAALLNNERRQRGERQRDDVNPTAARFLKSVELASVSVWGSSAERRQCRQEAFGYQTRYGQPSLFVTLTPNADNSYAMAHYTGILSVDTLFLSIGSADPIGIKHEEGCARRRLCVCSFVHAHG